MRPGHRLACRLVTGLSLLTVLAAAPAAAVDTVETFGKGEGDLEFYTGLDGLGADAPDQTVGGSMVMGWGVAERFSAYLATAVTADGHLGAAATDLDFGVFGTPVDTDHLDLDLMLDICSPSGDAVSVSPGLELNLDASPTMDSWGVFLGAAAAVSGHHADGEAPERQLDWALGIGVYRALGPGRQLFLSYDATVRECPEPGRPSYEHGGLAVGYNAVLGDTMELITEARTGFGGGGDPSTLGFMIGFVATLAGPASP
jgi:hypothetical protein